MPLSVARDIVQASVTAESDVHLQWAQRLVGEAPCKENGGRWQSVAPMMLPDTWAIVGMWLADHSVLDAGARGAKRKRADRFYRQSERIRAELVKLVKHPGYHGVAMLGVRTEVLAAWRSDAGALSPVRKAATQEGVMYPTPLVHRGRRITRWDFVELEDGGQIDLAYSHTEESRAQYLRLARQKQRVEGT